MALRLRTLNRSIGSISSRTVFSQPANRFYCPLRAMASAAPRTWEFLVVVPDKPGALERRLKVRPDHFAGLSKFVEAGVFKLGGAILEDVPVDDEPSSLKFAGSTFIVVAENREAILDILKDDVYVKNDVWDLEKIQIWPTKIAVRKPL